MAGTDSLSLATRARGYLDLLHPFPAAMTVLATGLFAAVAARGVPPSGPLAWLLLSVLLSQVAIASLNDYCDRALDAATKPWKPLPAGLVPPQVALAIGAAAAPLALLSALPLGPAAVLAAAVHTAAGLSYDLWFKGRAWSALPFVVGFPVLPIWAWSAVAPFDPRLLEAYPIGALLVVGLHLADTLPDLEADRAEGVRGLAHRLGPRRARWLLWAAFLSAPLFLASLAIVPGHAPRILLPAAATAGALVLGALTTSRGGETHHAGSIAARWHVAFALLASAAIVVGLGWLASLT